MLPEMKKSKENLSEKYHTSLVRIVTEACEVGPTASLAGSSAEYDGIHSRLLTISIRVPVSHHRDKILAIRTIWNGGNRLFGNLWVSE
tara:strand:+ start:2406 stop:2669 length:264 start_codon:yes stop_codon:yes gene_type:complete